MKIKSKIRIYKTCVRPIMTYAGETRAETTSIKQYLIEMRILRAIMGYTKYDRKTNEKIRQECGIQDVVRWIRRRRREWKDHIDRMENDRMPKIVKMNIPNTSRHARRPQKRWYESWTSTSQEG